MRGGNMPGYTTKWMCFEVNTHLLLHLCKLTHAFLTQVNEWKNFKTAKLKIIND